MKIVILVRILWTAGAPKIAIKEAMTLNSLGHDVELVFLRGRETKEYEKLLEGTNYSVVSETGVTPLSPLYDFITRRFSPDRGSESRVDYNLIRSFPKYLKNRGVDYLICHDQFAGLAGYYSKRKLGVNYSVFMHERVSDYNVPILGRLWSRYESKILENASSIFSITEKVGKTVRDKYRVEIRTNLPGLDMANMVDFNQKENSIIAVAMWDQGRKPHVYLDVIEDIPDFHLYMAGNWRIKPLRTAFLEEAKRRGIIDRVSLIEGIPEDELISLYRRSKFSIRFGFGEYGLGTSTVESIQQCVPLIVNSDLGTSDMIREYNCGLVLSEIDTSIIRDFILRNNNASKYTDLQNNISKLSERYTWRNHARRLLPI